MRYIGLSKCKLDAAGRIKLPPKVIQDFQEDGHGAEIVMYCLPEGALALFTPAIWEELRSKTAMDTPDLLNNPELRRLSRRIGACTHSDDISPQGRITIPPMFRDKLEFKEGEDIVIAGNERGYELWNTARWAAEEQNL